MINLLVFLLVLSSFLNFVLSNNHIESDGAFGKRHPPNELKSLSISNFTSNVRLLAITPITLNVSSTVYSNMQQITVTWKPIRNWCNGDYMGVYSTQIPLTSANDFYEYEWMGNGQASSVWTLPNLRQRLEFRYYSRTNNCTGTYTLVGQSSVIQPLNPNEPLQIHLAFSDRIDQMFVSYVTNSSNIPPQCQYGLSLSALNLQQNGTSITYQASDMCEAGANIIGPRNYINPGYMHTILINGLRPSTTYYYRVGNNEHGWSAIYSFFTRPADNNHLVNIIAYADLGVTYPASTMIGLITARAQSMNITGLLHLGDVAYAWGAGTTWEALMTQIEPIAARVPYMVSIGNHEYDHVSGGQHDPSGAPPPGGFRPSWGNYGYDSGGECAVPMVRRFRSPSNGNGIFWYSFDIGPVHVLIFSGEHDFTPSSVQYKWIEQDLQSVNHARTPWLITASHRTMFTSQTAFPDQTLVASKLILYLEPLLHKYRVDVNLYGHLHSYERSCAMYQQKCVQNGTVHVMIGNAGIGLIGAPQTVKNWTQYHDQQFGYAMIAANKTYLSFKYYHTFGNNIADQFTLYKNRISYVFER